MWRKYSPGWGWSLGWYTHSSKNEIAPTNGWTFNGGRCDPPNLGENIIIAKVWLKITKILYISNKWNLY